MSPALILGTSFETEKDSTILFHVIGWNVFFFFLIPFGVSSCACFTVNTGIVDLEKLEKKVEKKLMEIEYPAEKKK